MSDFMNTITTPSTLVGGMKNTTSERLGEIRDSLEAKKEDKAFKEFEQMFVHLMLKEMRKTVNESSFTEKSHATKMYQELMDESLATQMAESGQMGLARQLQESMKAERIRLEIQTTETSLTSNSLEQIKE